MTGCSYFARRADPGLLAQLSAIAPENPFATSQFFEARKNTGYEPWILGRLARDGALGWGCGAFVRSGRLNQSLEIVSLPPVEEASPFWHHLREFCRQRRVTRLVLHTFGSPEGVEIPPFPSESGRRTRCELSVDLSGDLVAMTDPKHRREVRKAQEEGLELKRSMAIDDLDAHYAAIGSSMDRRRGRGEQVSDATRQADHVALLRSGAAELFQAVRGGEVFSSAMVLLAKKGSYLYTTGTTPAGMAIGASHFLIHRTSAVLKADGLVAFALGGAEEGSGLARYKLRFGARPVYVPEVSCYVGPRWKQKIGSLLEFIRSGAQAVLVRTGRRLQSDS